MGVKKGSDPPEWESLDVMPGLHNCHSDALLLKKSENFR